MSTTAPEIGRSIAEEKRITPETEKGLRDALSSFSAAWS
jgi:hypothetical protein